MTTFLVVGSRSTNRYCVHLMTFKYYEQYAILPEIQPTHEEKEHCSTIWIVLSE